MRDFEHTRALVVHLRAEHRRLHKLLRRIEDAWSGVGENVSSGGNVATVIEGLEELRDDLNRHFAQEEQGGCLEEAVCSCPSMTHEVSRIELEHPLLRSQLERIIVRARSGAHADAIARETKQEFDEFARQLRAHEAEENRILAHAFGTQVEEFDTT